LITDLTASSRFAALLSCGLFKNARPALDDFFAAVMRRVHGDDSFSHVVTPVRQGRIGNSL